MQALAGYRGLMNLGLKVTKASGVLEDFNPNKLKASIQRAGADAELAGEIVRMVVPDVTPNMRTGKIYHLAMKYLKRLNHASGLRYSLKKALFRLGPTGYPFEKYFGKVLMNYGYSIEVGRVLEGRCIRHEVDVIAVNQNEVCVVECKYHNTPGRSTNSKDALYVHSRFQDLRPVLGREYPDRKFSGRLVTNTRLTADAIRYAECSGFMTIGWRHPGNKSLERMIESKRLYPVTVVTGIQAGLAERLIDRGIILLKDLADMDTERIQSLLSLPLRKAETLKRQAESICLC